MRKLFTRILSVCTSLLVVCTFVTGLHSSAIGFTPSFELHSASALAINLDNGMVMYQKNEDTQHPAGALCQIMAAVVVLEHCSDLNTHLTVDSSLYNELFDDDLRYCDIKDGDSFSVEELLYAMMLTSSCEAGAVLADYFGDGSEAAFAEMMNQKAQELGCTNTHFVNATGLHDENQYTTVKDMAIITRYALSVGKFETIATAASYSPRTPNFENHALDWEWTHSNTMMVEDEEYYTPNVKGIKTANDLGRNIVTLGSMDGNNYLVLLMAAPMEDDSGDLQYYHLEDAKTLLEWLYYHFSFETILNKEAELGQVKVANGDNTDYVLVRPANAYMSVWCDSADISSVVQKVTLEESVSAPVKEGQKLGTVELVFSGETLAVVDLVATSSVNLSPAKYWFAIANHFPKTPWFTRAIWGSVIFCGLYFVLCLLSFRNNKARLKPVSPVHLKPNLSAVKKEAQKAEKQNKPKS